MRPIMSQNLTATLGLAALLAVTGEALAQDNALSCSPNTGRTSARIDCLNKITHALSDKIESLRAELAQASKPTDLSDYIHQSELKNFLSGYVKYNSPLAINMSSEPSTSQTGGRCLAADLAQEGVVIDNPCNYDAKPALKWQLLPAMKTSAVQSEQQQGRSVEPGTSPAPVTPGATGGGMPGVEAMPGTEGGRAPPEQIPTR
jgi:hypothetical protein